LRISDQVCLSRALAIFICLCVAHGFALGQSQPYLVANNDSPFSNGLSFYTIGATGLLSLKRQVLTEGAGIGGGYFATNRVSMVNSGSNQCVYASNAASGDISGININTMEFTSSASGSSTDGGTSNGIGLAMNSQYLYASFSDSNTIGTFQVESGCGLMFVNDVSVAGLQGGIIDGMAISGNILVVTYGDGSIESFNISSGMPVPNGDEQNSTAYGTSTGASYPSAVEITQDGHYALFGDTSTSALVEVSDISSGRLTKTIAYTLGSSIGSSNIILSPDETLLYIGNNQGDQITAAWFNASTGNLTAGCTSGKLRDYGAEWSYLAGLALETNTATGGMVYVTEFGNPDSSSHIGMVQVSSVGGKCTLQEVSSSPALEFSLGGLLSIGTFPPRSF
jgi:6-phosphogluconolactonase (cycloisomerase 2 family)